MAVDSASNVDVADQVNHTIRLGTPVPIHPTCFNTELVVAILQRAISSRGHRVNQSTGPHPGNFGVTGGRLDYAPNRDPLDRTDDVRRPERIQFQRALLPPRISGAVEVFLLAADSEVTRSLLFLQDQRKGRWWLKPRPIL